VRLRLSKRRTDTADEELRAMPEVLEAHNVTGTDDYLVKIAVRDIDHMSDVNARLSALLQVDEIVTYVVLDTPVARRVVTEAIAHAPGDGADGRDTG
jgi:Lrp/AsnC family transcriptional regulator, leucine-responsive regulatory protein